MAKKLEKIVTLKGMNGEVYEIWIESIGPIQASKYLKNVGKQRKIKDNHIRQLSDIMRNGHWDDLNGDTIVFDKEGRVMNGQHRLRSIIESGYTMTVFCIKGVASDVYFSVDQGLSPRRLRDLLGILNEQYTTELAGAINYLHKYRIDMLGSTSFGTALIDNREAYQLLKRNATLRDSVRWAVTVSNATPFMHLGKSALAFLNYVLTKIDNEKAITFLDVLTYSSEAPENDCPTYHLRQRFKKAEDTTRRRDKMRSVEKLAWTIKAWNYFVQDRRTATSKIIVWRLGEPFPRIKDAEGEIFPYSLMIKS